MALPISPPPKSDDVAIHGWAGITVSVAWTLLTLGVKVRREVLDAAREHVLYHLSPTTSLPLAEDRAAHLTQRFVASARGKLLEDPWPADAEMSLTERWVRAIQALRDRTTRAVFRMHYGDNRPLDHICARLELDPVSVDAAREGLREVLRKAARQDGLPLDAWPAARLDRVLTRLAAWAPDSCPPTYDVANGAHRTHVQACPRCNRMVRLMHAGTLELQDLLPPTLRARPTTELTMLVLHFHPAGRAHRDALKRSLPGDPVAIEDDLLLLPVGERSSLFEVLRLAAELKRPERHLLRGVVLTGPGGWSRFGPLGPLGRKASREVLNRAWGVIDGLGALPEPLPEPPSASLAWVAVGGLAMAAAGALWFATLTSPGGASGTFADFVPHEGGLYARFDVPEDRLVTVISFEGRNPQIVLAGTSVADKASVAVGDGSYLAHLPPGEALLFTHSTPIDLDPLLNQARTAADPLAALSEAVITAYPGTTLFRHAL